MNRIGFSTRLGGDGKLHPYLAAVEIDGRLRTSLIALPAGGSYVIPPVHPLYGNLLSGPSLDEVTNAIHAHLQGRRVYSHADNRGMGILDGIDIEYVDTELPDSGEQAHSQINALREHQHKRQAS